jgi:hypothetical protein
MSCSVEPMRVCRQPPLRAINTYLDGFHFYSGHLQAQMEAHHYCAIVNEDFIQCVIYDGNLKDAKLMGVEAEHALMQKLIHTYGKTWHTWHTNLDKQLPLGVPQLMMGFTTDGQADPAMVQARDRRFGVDTEQEERNRADIAAPSIDAGANG